jgi:hypothetical protein
MARYGAAEVNRLGLDRQVDGFQRQRPARGEENGDCEKQRPQNVSGAQRATSATTRSRSCTGDAGRPQA